MPSVCCRLSVPFLPRMHSFTRPASVVAPVWNTQPIISFFLARITLKGIEVVTFRDGIAAALVVIGVLVMRWA